MRLRRSSPKATCLLLTTLPFTTAINLDCARARDNGKTFDLSALRGPKTVTETEDRPPKAYLETAFTIDICNTLTKTGPKGEGCPIGTNVCGITTLFNPFENSNTTEKTIPIAGDILSLGGGHSDPKWTRLSTSPIQSDRDKEGIRLTLGGGLYMEKPQKAVVEFLCDRKDESEDRMKALLSREDADEGEDGGDDKKDEEREAKKQTDDGEGGILKFMSYGPVGADEVLSLEWRTKYACEDAKDGGKKKSSSHWGFFTWFIIIVFLAIAAYLIFGSWLNYNRYSARGWDLVPHSETLRDIPYIFKDWMRRVVNTFQGGGSRGGYSAV